LSAIAMCDDVLGL